MSEIVNSIKIEHEAVQNHINRFKGRVWIDGKEIFCVTNITIDMPAEGINKVTITFAPDTVEIVPVDG
jgi:hypothetical protein